MLISLSKVILLISIFRIGVIITTTATTPNIVLQSEFVLETIKLLKENGVHTAIDTAGVGEGYDEVLDLVDLVILDIKAVDAKEYKELTGRDFSDFYAFAEKCKQKK